MREHEERISVEIPPSTLREDDELTEIANSGITFAYAADVDVGTVRGIPVRVLSVAALGNLNGGGDLVVRIASNVGLNVRMDQDVQVSSCRCGRWQVMEIVCHLGTNAAWSLLLQPIGANLFPGVRGGGSIASMLPPREKLSLLAHLDRITAPGLGPRRGRFDRILLRNACPRYAGNRLHRCRADVAETSRVRSYSSVVIRGPRSRVHG